jgi:hypothetical protein
MSYGKGEVLVFCGVVDWLACEGLASAVDAWGRNEPWTGKTAGDPTMIASAFENHGAIYIVGRRFIGHDEIDKIAGGVPLPGYMTPAPRECVFPNLAPGTYHVRDLVNGTDLGALPAADLSQRGVTLMLTPGQGFLLEAKREGQ